MNKKYLKNVWTLDISKIGILSQEIETIQTVYGTFQKPAGLIIKGNDFLATQSMFTHLFELELTGNTNLTETLEKV